MSLKLRDTKIIFNYIQLNIIQSRTGARDLINLYIDTNISTDQHLRPWNLSCTSRSYYRSVRVGSASACPFTCSSVRPSDLHLFIRACLRPSVIEA